MIRTFWLGLILLVGLAALASFKLAFGSPRPVAAAELAAAANIQDESTVGTSAVPDLLAKGDRLQVTYVPVVDPVPVQPVAMVVPVTPESPTIVVAPKIISRHWHDPSDQTIAQVSTRKLKRSKKGPPVVERKPVLEANACTSDGLFRIKRFFNPATNCQSR